MSSVLVLNKDYSPLSWVDVPRAVTLLLTVNAKGKPHATMFMADPDRQIRSAYMSLEWPQIIVLNRYVHAPYATRAKDPCGFASNKDILIRDKHACAYCGGRATTIDHVFPRSRGGADSWENLVAACTGCNNKKADRTPEEWCRAAGKHKQCRHKLLWQPRPLDTGVSLQKMIWDKLEALLAVP